MESKRDREKKKKKKEEEEKAVSVILNHSARVIRTCLPRH